MRRDGMAGASASILPDVLDAGMLAVFCGTRAGRRSGGLKAYYAGPGNRFWPTLHETKLTPTRISPEDFDCIRQHGLGLTDLCQRSSGGDAGLRARDFDVTAFVRKTRDYAPVIVAFNGKKAAQVVLGKRRLEYGPQAERIHGAEVWVLPSTAGSANGHWKPNCNRWCDLATRIRRLRNSADREF